MSEYRIKHKPTGLYLKPIDGSSYTNLTTKEFGKIYSNEKAFNYVVGQMYNKGTKKDDCYYGTDWYSGLYAEGKKDKVYIKNKNEFEKEYVTCDCESLPHIFVARDKNGDLYCFPDKPEKDETLGQYKGCGFFIPLIDNEIFKGITWETGPKILILKDVIEC